MRTKIILSVSIIISVLLFFSNGYTDNVKNKNREEIRSIITSDTILSDMAASLLPKNRYSVEAILPPGQCPGHYDVKLSDIEKIKKAELKILFKGMPFMDNASLSGGARLVVDENGRNWMAPDSYIYGLNVLAYKLSVQFPEDRAVIMSQKMQAIDRIKRGADLHLGKIRKAGISGKPAIASFMQKELLKWMGLDVVAEYGRPEAMSAKDIVRITKIGREKNAVIVVDNLQSGPDTGRGIAETLKLPHVVLTNFPSEKGYIATLGENISRILAVLAKK